MMNPSPPVVRDLRWRSGNSADWKLVTGKSGLELRLAVNCWQAQVGCTDRRQWIAVLVKGSGRQHRSTLLVGSHQLLYLIYYSSYGIADIEMEYR